MGTVLRNELSENSKYYIPKHRMLELKHFCMQYHDWITEYNKLSNVQNNFIRERVSKTNRIIDPTALIAERKAKYATNIELVERIARETDQSLYNYILDGVTSEHTYEYYRLRGIPCCRNVYYKYYREFFCRLDAAK